MSAISTIDVGEADADIRDNLAREIHIVLSGSFTAFFGRRCLRAWLYRVAHNVATSHVIRQRRAKVLGLIGFNELENLSEANSRNEAADRNQDLARLMDFIRRPRQPGRRVILSYLEGMEAWIGEITAPSAKYISTKRYRSIKVECPVWREIRI